jgi:spore germination protein KB
MNNKLAYFLSKSSMFGLGYFLLCNLNDKNTYLSIILGTILGLFIIYIYSKISNYSNYNIHKYLNNTFIGKIFNIILLLFYIYILLITILTITTFINSFYLIKTPRIIIILSILLLSIYLSFKDNKALINLSNIFFCFSIFIVILFTILLIPYSNINELLPIFNYNNINILKGSIIYALISTVPLIIINNYNTNIKITLKNYLVASIINLTIVIGTTLSLGNLLNVYRFPEYAVLKQIRILDFIENIENISAFGWYAESFIVISLTIFNIKDTLSFKYNKLYLVILLLSLIPMLILSNNYDLLLKVFYIHPYILLIFFIIFLLLLIYLKLKKKYQ